WATAPPPTPPGATMVRIASAPSPTTSVATSSPASLSRTLRALPPSPPTSARSG
ncbi:hypothetical protein CFC21_018503, partial [Triticum aestivum]